MLLSLFVISAALYTSATALNTGPPPDLSGRWIQDSNLSVFELIRLPSSNATTIVYSVENKFYEIGTWRNATLTHYVSSTGKDLKVELSIPSIFSILYGDLWSNYTRVTYENSGGDYPTTWHRYLSDLTCFQQTLQKKPKAPSARKSPTAIKKVLHHGPWLQQPNVTRVHVVITTHFDLGYTDYAWCTVSHYMWQIYPGIVNTALADPTFIYTTEPWLLYFFFNCDRLLQYVLNVPGIDLICPTPEMVSDLGSAIQRGQVTWEAFAFDGFNELMGRDIFSLGFDFAFWLSDHFGVPRVRTMSNIDVPGVFAAQLPILKSKNVTSLYIGQNPFDVWAGAPLHMEKIFMWDGVLTMVHKLGYGGITPFDAIINPTTNEALVVQCVLENSPPYTPTDIAGYISRIQRYFPNAIVAPSTFDSFSQGVWKTPSAIPVNTLDMGDAWIRAIPSDPVKTATFLKERRNFEACLNNGICKEYQTQTMDEVFFLMTGAEHNFGLPVQSNNWEAPAASYQEKRNFLTSAAMVRPRESTSSPVLTLNNATQALPNVQYNCSEWDAIQFDTQGAITRLSFKGKVYSSPAYPLGTLLYSIHALQGLYNNVSDGGGDPLSYAALFRSTPSVRSGSFDPSTCTFALELIMDQNRTNQNLKVITVFTFSTNLSSPIATFSYKIIGKELSYAMYGSWMSKVPRGDSLSIGFLPVSLTAPHWSVSALGTSYDPSLFNLDGVSHFHVADWAVLPGVVSISPQDTPLLMFGNNSASWSSGDWVNPPDYSQGAWFNIFNQWNSNWVSGWPWEDGEVVEARFTLTFL